MQWPEGMALVKRMDDIDAKVLASAARAIGTRDVEITVRTLRAVREGFEDTARWAGEVAAEINWVLPVGSPRSEM